MAYLETLRGDEFRVFQLDPSPNSESPITGNLATVSRKSGIKYDALSYVWGDLAETVTATINNTEIAITRNLDIALRHLRHQTRPVTIWIDALCINQSNVPERNHQVQSMGDVYRQAMRVCMWVGEHDGDIPAAMRLLKTCLEPCGFKFTSNMLTCWEPTTLDDDETITIDQTQAKAFAHAVISNAEGCSALTKLLSRPYWRRMWIFQEVVLAARPFVKCGSFAIAWAAFRYLDAAAENPHIWLPLQGKYPWVFPLRKALFDVSHLFMTTTEASMPDNVLQPTRHLECRDPRDKLYALLGVWMHRPTTTLTRFGLGGDAAMPIDYAKPVRDVYTDFAIAGIKARHDLSVILTAGVWQAAHGPDLGIPSWVPDLRGDSGIDIRFLAAYHLSHFDASGQRTFAMPEKIVDRFTLPVRGVIIDTISKTIQHTTPENPREHATLKEIARLDKTQTHPSGLSHLHVFFRTAIFDHKDFVKSCGHPQSTAEAKDWMKRLAFGFCREIQAFNSFSDIKLDVDGFLTSISHSKDFNPPSGDNNNDNREQDLLAEFADLSNDDREMEAFRTEYLYRSGSKAVGTSSLAFFVAAGGHVGLGPASCLEGDRLGVFHGCPTPLVVRRAGRDVRGMPGYWVVGPCYLYGMMNGEVFKRGLGEERMYFV